MNEGVAAFKGEASDVFSETELISWGVLLFFQCFAATFPVATFLQKGRKHVKEHKYKIKNS